MEYGILIAESDAGSYQVIGEVSSRQHAKEMVRMYLQWADPESDLCPDRFIIHKRNVNGTYAVRDEVDLNNLSSELMPCFYCNQPVTAHSANCVNTPMMVAK